MYFLDKNARYSRTYCIHIIGNPPPINEDSEGDEDVYELYNIHTDPSESINLIEDYPDLFQTMKAQMLELVNDFVIEDKPDDGLDIDITDGEGNLATGWC